MKRFVVDLISVGISKPQLAVRSINTIESSCYGLDVTVDGKPVEALSAFLNLSSVGVSVAEITETADGTWFDKNMVKRHKDGRPVCDPKVICGNNAGVFMMLAKTVKRLFVWLAGGVGGAVGPERRQVNGYFGMTDEEFLATCKRLKREGRL